MTSKLIEIQSTKELPAGVEFVLYEPPYHDNDELHEVITEFTAKCGYEPQTIYRLGKQLYAERN
jgi:hypothetical protein